MNLNEKKPNTSKNKIPLVAVDTVVFRITNEGLSVLLIQIGSGIYKDKWAVPGGLVRVNESLDDAAIRVLNEKAHLTHVYLEQLYTFGDVDRDKRGRSISVSYFALLPSTEELNVEIQTYYKDIKWFLLNNLPELAFDHKKIIETALQRLRDKLSYTNIVYSLLPKEFALTQLQSVYETILGKKLDKRNFRKKMLALGIVEPLDKRETNVVHRPAVLYKFRARRLETF